MSSATTHAILTAELMATARVLADDLNRLYRERVNAGGDPQGEAEARDRAFYDGLVAAGMMPRDALRTIERFT